MKEKIKAVKFRIKYFSNRIRSGNADLSKANKKIQHFLNLAKEGVIEWRKAEKQNRPANMKKAKAKTQKAHRKLAFWHEVKDDVVQGQKKALRRRKHQQKKLSLLKKNQNQGSPANAGFTNIDGKQVPNWMAPGILELRRRGLWNGIIVSGYRTPEYSRQLCRGICGADSCPGRCAGVSSNHTCPPTFTGVPHEGAVDVTDYYRFGSGCRVIGLPLQNDLPYDRVHYSYTGH